MGYATITGITVAIAVVIVIGIALLSYMSSLIKSAYQIKVEMRQDLDNGLKKIEEELRQKSKWMRSEVGEDVAKMKQTLERENETRLTQIQEHLQGTVREIDQASRDDRVDLRNALLQQRNQLAAVTQQVTALKDEAARRAAIGRPHRKDASVEEALSASRTGPPASDDAGALSADASLGPDGEPQPPTEPSSASLGTGSEGSGGNRVVGPTTAGGSKRMALQDFGKDGGSR